MSIHRTAIVDKQAEIDPSVEIGAYAVVERNVRIAPGTRLSAHAYVGEGTTLGERCRIHPFAVVGHVPQDVSFKGEPSFTRIGDDTVVREHASIHRGAIPGSTTEVGRRCFIMATAHVAHNCRVGDGVVIANGGLLAGHVEVGSRAFLSGGTAVHQFVRIGELAMLGGGHGVPKDVPPFLLTAARGVVGPNVVGLRRAEFSAGERLELRQAYRLLYRSGTLFRAAIERVAKMVQTDPGRRLVEFLRGESRRGLMGFKRRCGPAVRSEDQP